MERAREGQDQGAVLYVGVREGFSEKVAFEQRHEGGGQEPHGHWGKWQQAQACAKALRQEVLSVFVLEEQQRGQHGWRAVGGAENYKDKVWGGGSHHAEPQRLEDFSFTHDHYGLCPNPDDLRAQPVPAAAVAGPQETHFLIGSLPSPQSTGPTA